MPDPRLSFEGWLECMGRCALGLYGPIELLNLHHLVDCTLRNLLQSQTIEAAVDKVSGEAAARLFAAGWDRTDAASREIQKTTGVQRQMASEAFINDVKARQAQLEDKWVAAAEARGLKNARAVLAEFRAETQKLK